MTSDMSHDTEPTHLHKWDVVETVSRVRYTSKIQSQHHTTYTRIAFGASRRDAPDTYCTRPARLDTPTDAIHMIIVVLGI
jgi:hypothetical protein